MAKSSSPSSMFFQDLAACSIHVSRLPNTVLFIPCASARIVAHFIILSRSSSVRWMKTSAISFLSRMTVPSRSPLDKLYAEGIKKKESNPLKSRSSAMLASILSWSCSKHFLRIPSTMSFCVSTFRSAMLRSTKRTCGLLLCILSLSSANRAMPRMFTMDEFTSPLTLISTSWDIAIVKSMIFLSNMGSLRSIESRPSVSSTHNGFAEPSLSVGMILMLSPLVHRPALALKLLPKRKFKSVDFPELCGPMTETKKGQAVDGQSSFPTCRYIFWSSSACIFKWSPSRTSTGKPCRTSSERSNARASFAPSTERLLTSTFWLASAAKANSRMQKSIETVSWEIVLSNSWHSAPIRFKSSCAALNAAPRSCSAFGASTCSRFFRSSSFFSLYCFSSGAMSGTANAAMVSTPITKSSMFLVFKQFLTALDKLDICAAFLLPSISFITLSSSFWHPSRLLRSVSFFRTRSACKMRSAPSAWRTVNGKNLRWSSFLLLWQDLQDCHAWSSSSLMCFAILLMWSGMAVSSMLGYWALTLWTSDSIAR
mmetsp:Transcript_85853/g.262707  ORF Transcript_85853/g.262707 Transcript_85853/m.262707 type:complete len:540 (+) Transcript_85853:506-2125(+)